MFSFENSVVYHKGEYINSKEANVSIGNTGFLYGLAVFTGMRVFKNPVTEKLYIFRPKDHFNRLKFSCKILRILRSKLSISYFSM